MRNILRILVILSLIGVASAAVFVTFNPEAKLSFSRPAPPADVSPVQALFDLDGEGTWSNSIGLGEMDGNVLSKDILFRNGQAETYTGRVYMILECDEGLVENYPTEGLKEFDTILFTGPDGQTSTINFDANMERIDEFTVLFTTSYGSYDFHSMEDLYGHVELNFVDLAYGNYTMTVYVE